MKIDPKMRYLHASFVILIIAFSIVKGTSQNLLCGPALKETYVYSGKEYKCKVTENQPSKSKKVICNLKNKNNNLRKHDQEENTSVLLFITP